MHFQSLYFLVLSAAILSHTIPSYAYSMSPRDMGRAGVSARNLIKIGRRSLDGFDAADKTLNLDPTQDIPTNSQKVSGDAITIPTDAEKSKQPGEAKADPGAAKNQDGKVRDTVEGITGKLEVERKKLDVLKQKMAAKTARIDELEKRLARVKAGKPSKDPTKDPSKDPTKDPSKDPTKDPSKDPTKDPSKDPTKDPSKDPTKDPSKDDPASKFLGSVDPSKNPKDDKTNDGADKTGAQNGATGTNAHTDSTEGKDGACLPDNAADGPDYH